MRTRFTRSLVRSFALVVSTLGCTTETREPAGSTESRSHARREGPPLLDRVQIAPYLDTLFWTGSTFVGILDSGRLAIASDALPDEHLITVLDASSGEMWATGRKGEGPGELVDVSPILTTDATIHVMNDARRVVIEYSASGKFSGESRYRFEGGFVVGVSSDSMDVMAHRWLPRGGLVTRYAKRSSGSRVLVPASDSFARGAMGARPGEPRTRGILAFVSSEARYVVADPFRYEVRWFAADGRALGTINRELPPKRLSPEEAAERRWAIEQEMKSFGRTGPIGEDLVARLDTLDRVILPQFLWPGLGFDHTGRLWILGELGDSTFADVFTETAFLTRIMLPCQKPGRRVAIRGEWILLHCEEPQSISAPYRLQLYRIVDRNDSISN